MNKPHKHADVIKAWADGAQVESFNNIDGWRPTSHPLFSKEAEYRIAPPPDFAVVYHVGEVDTVRVTYDGTTRRAKAVELVK